MIVAPCSVRSLGEIATEAASTLLAPAADVVLKERWRIVLMVRGTPLHTGRNLEDMVDHAISRIPDLRGPGAGAVTRWGEAPAAMDAPRR